MIFDLDPVLTLIRGDFAKLLAPGLEQVFLQWLAQNYPGIEFIEGTEDYNKAVEEFRAAAAKARESSTE